MSRLLLLDLLQPSIMQHYGLHRDVFSTDGKSLRVGFVESTSAAYAIYATDVSHNATDVCDQRQQHKHFSALCIKLCAISISFSVRRIRRARRLPEEHR